MNFHRLDAVGQAAHIHRRHHALKFVPVAALLLVKLGFIGAAHLHFHRQMGVAIGVKTNAILVRIAQFNDVDALEIDNFAGQVLKRRLLLVQDES